MSAPRPEALNPPASRLPYTRPEVRELGPVATVTETVSMRGNMDGFMGRRTG